MIPHFFLPRNCAARFGFLALAVFFFITPLLCRGGESGKSIPFTLKQEEDDRNLSNQGLRNEVERLLFEKTNGFRSNKKLKSLGESDLMQKAARFHSQDMLKRHYLSHMSPEGASVLERIRRFKPKYDESCGENLHQISSSHGLKDPEAIASQMMEDWSHSPSHKKNLLSKEYEFLGVGCATNGKDIYCTQVFSGPEI